MALLIHRRAVLGGLCASAAAGAFATGASASSIWTGRFRFELSVPFLEGRAMRVWGYRPRRAGADAPLVFVLHGQGRNADEYRDYWVARARRHGLIVLAPEFDRGNFPGALTYNQGRVLDAEGGVQPPEQWSFSVIEALFDLARERLGSEASRYFMFGHSAGAQFVHRFMLFNPGARVARAIAANAGWYTWPDAERPYPYGWADAGLDEAAIAAYLAAPMTLMLGDQDTDANQSSLNNTPPVRVQGPHRFARGQAMFEAARAEAERRDVTFGWRLEIVPGVAHSGERMSQHAANYLGTGS